MRSYTKTMGYKGVARQKSTNVRKNKRINIVWDTKRYIEQRVYL